jgi:cell division protein FtsB
LARENNRATLFIILSFCAAVYFFAFSESGFLERRELDKNRKLLAARIERLRDENTRLRNVYARYRNGEFLEQEAHKAGYAAPGERVVFFRDGGGAGEAKRKDSEKVESIISNVSHLRILWLVISALAVLFYFTGVARNRNEQHQ